MIFGRNDNEKETTTDATKDQEDAPTTSTSSPFQKILDKLKLKRQQDEGSPSSAIGSDAIETAVPPSSSNRPETSEKRKAAPTSLTPAQLQAQAAKTRLEAEKLEAELTLEKIQKLETALQKAAARPENRERLEELQKQMELLESKLLSNKPKETHKKEVVQQKSSTTSSSKDDDDNNSSSTTVAKIVVVPPPDQEDYQDLIELFQESPNFMKKALATQVEIEDFESVEDLNATEIALRLEQMNRLDFSYSKRPKPTFTSSQIREKQEELTRKTGGLVLPGLTGNVEKRMKEMAQGNQTQMAILALEYDYYTKGTLEITDEQLQKLVEGDEWLQSIVDAANKSSLDSSIETLYPKCMRREENPLPPIEQVEKLVADVLPQTSFRPSSKPEPVAGGYILRGSAKTDVDGDQIIDEVDKAITSKFPALKDTMTVLYTQDFTVFSTEAMDDNMMGDVGFPEASSILYITGPNVVRESKPVQLSIVSSLGLATSWYLAIYPFLFNPDIAKRVDEQLALADANMNPDLSWLSDMSIPLFATFLGIHILHDLGHRIVSAVYDFKTSAPTFVPSIITGLTGTVTSFRSLPKNKQQMFDYAVAGPLIGMIASLLAITIGSELSVGADPSILPALPLEILRQSSLGGGIIDAVLGNGALSVPEGALGTQAVAGMTIPLHPVAIAGYIGLLVNALEVLPIGTTDGGRMAMTLFGRASKILIGNIALFLTFFAGFAGSDLFLFYFAFCIAFQAGNDVPARNEVDGVDFSRVLVATSTYVIAALALIPFQS